MDLLDSQELPIIAAALERLEYRDPFLLTVLAGEGEQGGWSGVVSGLPLC
jgi:hypothetical protein